MRQRTIDTKTRDTKRGVSNKARGGKTGFVASEPTCEHVYTVKKKRKFNDDEVALLIGIRKELAEKGFRDGKIACVLAERFNRSQGSYREKIRHLVADGILAFNPGHIPRFSKEEDASIEKKRSVLIKKGKSDKEIAWLICGEINRNAAAAYRRILKLVHCGAIESNPAYRTPIQGPKFEKIKRLRLGLIPLGLDDMAIAARIATMMDGQKVLNVYSLIRSWVSKGRLKENPNRIPGFNKEELDKIAALWTNLVGTNISDEAISREISKLLPNRSPRSIHNKISELRKNGIIGNNPFLKPARKFNENEVEILIQIRKELVSSGFTDEDIAKKVGKRLGRSLSSTRKVISRLLRDGQIETNPHGRQSISEHDIQRITEIRRELIGSEMNDKKIASEISARTGLHCETVYHRIRSLVRRGMIPENQYLGRKLFSKEEASLISSKRMQLISAGYSDHRISRIIAEGSNHSPSSVMSFIRKMVMKSAFSENPNNPIKPTNQVALLSGLRQAPEAMEKFGEGK